MLALLRRLTLLTLLIAPLAGCGSTIQGEPSSDLAEPSLSDVDPNPGNTNSNTSTDPTVIQYFPDWAEATPQSVRTFDYNNTKTALANGLALKSWLESAATAPVAGEHLIVGSGNYEINSPIVIDSSGTAINPIRITTAIGATTIEQLSNDQPTIQIGKNSEVQYLLLQGFELIGGKPGVDIRQFHNLWLDQLTVRDTFSAGIGNSVADQSKLYVSRSLVHNTYKEGIVLWRLSESVIGKNEITDTTLDGIAITQDSFANHIVGNTIHHLKDNKTNADPSNPFICNPICYNFPGIRFWRGPLAPKKPVNVVQNNVVYNIKDNCIQGEGGDVDVIGNLASECSNKNIDFSHGITNLEVPPGSGNWVPQSSIVDRVRIINNTLFQSSGSGNGIGLNSWVGEAIGQMQLICVNNVVYAKPGSGFSIGVANIDHPSVPGEVHDNVVYGKAISNFPEDYPWTIATVGNGFDDFANMTANYQVVDQQSFIEDATPLLSGIFNGMGQGFGDAEFSPAVDVTNMLRTNPMEVGAIDTPAALP